MSMAPPHSSAPAYPQGASRRIRTPWNVPGTYLVVLGNSQELHGAGRDPWDAPGSSREASKHRTRWNVPGTYLLVLGNSKELQGAGRDPWDAPGSSLEL